MPRQEHVEHRRAAEGAAVRQGANNTQVGSRSRRTATPGCRSVKRLKSSLVLRRGFHASSLCVRVSFFCLLSRGCPLPCRVAIGRSGERTHVVEGRLRQRHRSHSWSSSRSTSGNVVLPSSTYSRMLSLDASRTYGCGREQGQRVVDAVAVLDRHEDRVGRHAAPSAHRACRRRRSSRGRSTASRGCSSVPVPRGSAW